MATQDTNTKPKVFCGECHILVAPYAKQVAEGVAPHKVVYHAECYPKMIRKRLGVPRDEGVPRWALHVM